MPPTSKGPKARPPVNRRAPAATLPEGPRPAGPSQRALDRWAGESPAPGPDRDGPSSEAGPAARTPRLPAERARLEHALRALMEAVQALATGPAVSPAATARAEGALDLARRALGDGRGHGLLRPAARQAHAAQRADPTRSPHFGG